MSVRLLYIRLCRFFSTFRFCALLCVSPRCSRPVSSTKEAPLSYLAERDTEHGLHPPSPPSACCNVEFSHPPPPPTPDQPLVYRPLQTYMLMIGAPVGDLVQFVKTGAAGSRGNGKRGASAKEARAAADDVLVSRVELDCRTYHHKKHWEETILPRLYAFARMVYRFRGDDLLRWRYLLAAPVRSPMSGMNYCCGV